MEARNSHIAKHGKLDDLLALIGLLYDTTAAPERWRNFLEAGAVYFGSFGANFIRFDPARPECAVGYLVGYGDVHVNQQIGALQRFVSLRYEDPRLKYGFEHPCKPFHCRQIVSSEILHASRSYREVLRPNNVEYSLLVTFSETPGGFTGLAFMRDQAGAEFDQDDVEDMGRLVPHLRRSLSIQDRLATQEQRMQASCRVLDSFPSGVVILRHNGHVEYANPSAMKILSLRDGVGLHEGVLIFARQRDEQMFFASLNRVLQSSEHCAMHIDRPSGRTALRGLLSQLLAGEAKGLPNLLEEQRVVFYLSDPECSLETPEELLQRMFGLTRAEARLVERLVAGLSPTVAAIEMGLEVSTVRSYLKSVFRKLGVDSQPALVRVILSSPAWMAGGQRS